MKELCLTDWVENVDMLLCGQMFAVSGRTQQEQIDALLNEISDEVEIDARASYTAPAADITGRLNQMKRDVNTSGYDLLATNCFKFS